MSERLPTGEQNVLPRLSQISSWAWEISLFLNFAMQSMATQMFVVLHLFNAFRLLLFIASSHVPGNRFVLRSCFSAFNYYVFSWHNSNGFRIKNKGCWTFECSTQLFFASNLIVTVLLILLILIIPLLFSTYVKRMLKSMIKIRGMSKTIGRIERLATF